MLIPVGEEVAVPVTVVVLGPEPEVLRALLRRLEVDTLQVEITPSGLAVARSTSDREPLPPLGTRLIVTAGDRVKLPGRILGSRGDRWVVSREGARASDDRAAPRFAAVLKVRWRVAGAEGGGPRRQAGPSDEKWLTGGPDPGPFVDFRGPADLSLSGVGFDCTSLVPPVGARLLIELHLSSEGPVSLPERPVDPRATAPTTAGAGGARHRAIGAVRRIDVVGERTQVGVEFVELPEATFDALSDYTLRNL
jgi:hypothetical protein